MKGELLKTAVDQVTVETLEKDHTIQGERVTLQELDNSQKVTKSMLLGYTRIPPWVKQRGYPGSSLRREGRKIQ